MELVLNKRNDVWLDNSLIQICKMIKDIMTRYNDVVDCSLEEDKITVNIKDEDKFIKLFSDAVLLKLNNILLKVQDNKGIEKRIIKEHILLQYGKKVNGQNTVGEKLFEKEQTPEILRAFVNQTGKPKKMEKCLLCGQNYNSSVSNRLGINDIKQAVYPLTTKNSAISHIRTKIKEDGFETGSNSSNFSNICPQCYVLGVLQYANEGMVFNTDISKEKAYMFLPSINNLKEADLFREHCIKEVLIENRRYCNIKIPELDTTEDGKHKWLNGKYTAFLAFLEKVADINQVEQNQDEFLFLKPDIRKFKDWYVIETGTGKLKNPTLRHIKILDKVYEIIFESQLRPFKNIIKNVWFTDNWDLTYERQEQMAQAFVEDNFNKFSQAFKTSHGDSIDCKWDTLDDINNLIYEWEWKGMGLEKDLLDEIKNVGMTIGMVSYKRKSLVYQLERVRNIEEMLKFLAEFTKGLYAVWEELKEDFGDKTKFISLEKIKDFTCTINTLGPKEFETVKNTLLINAFIQLTWILKDSETIKKNIKKGE